MLLEVFNSDPLCMKVECDHYEIFKGILIAINNDGNPIVVIKKWDYFTVVYQELPKNPDQFYEALDEDDE